jgi:hypothetical protein
MSAPHFFTPPSGKGGFSPYRGGRRLLLPRVSAVPEGISSLCWHTQSLFKAEMQLDLTAEEGVELIVQRGESQ